MMIETQTKLVCNRPEQHQQQQQKTYDARRQMCKHVVLQGVKEFIFLHYFMII